jgi:hypothetical protein
MGGLYAIRAARMVSGRKDKMVPPSIRGGELVKKLEFLQSRFSQYLTDSAVASEPGSGSPGRND